MTARNLALASVLAFGATVGMTTLTMAQDLGTADAYQYGYNGYSAYGPGYGDSAGPQYGYGGFYGYGAGYDNYGAHGGPGPRVGNGNGAGIGAER